MSAAATVFSEIVESENESNANLVNLSRNRRTLAGTLILSFAVLAALVAGGWGVLSSITVGDPPARIGEAVEVPGGLMSVDRVTPEHMASMQKGKFAQAGMSMSSTGMDMAPDGYRRFAVDVSLAAQSGSLAYSPEDFEVSGEDMKTHGPIRTQLEAGSLATGDAISGLLVFQVPEKSKNLTLDFDGGRGVALDVPASEGGSHSQEGGSRNGGHDH